MDFLAEMCAVVVRLDISARIFGVDMETVEVSADPLSSCEGLGGGRLCFEDDIFGAASPAWCRVAVRCLLWFGGVVLRLNSWNFVHGVVVFGATLWC